MKKTSKALLLGLCALLLVGASVLGTMAYLTSNDKVVNTFTVGKVAITLDETKVNTDGTLDATASGRVQENDYHLLPGHEYTKDPIVHVDSKSEKCYLFVKVTNGIKNIEDQTNEGVKTVAKQMESKGWNVVDETNGIYVYGTVATPTEVDASSNIPVFDNFTIAGTVDNTQLESYEGATIVVTAYAIQKDGFAGKTASQIWADASFN